MKELPLNLIIEKNKIANPNAWLVALDINLTNGTIIRLVRNNENITYNGNEYQAFNFELEPTETSNKGEIPSVTLRCSNITKVIQPYLEELDGAINSTVKITVINSAHLSEDYSMLEMTFDVMDCSSSAKWVTFTLGAPNPLYRSFPKDRCLALHCNWRFNDVVRQDGFECGYIAKDIESITLSGSNPVSIQITGHGFVAGDDIKFAEIEGTTELNGNSYLIEVTDDNNFTLNSTDSSAFSTYTSGGKAGFASCKRTLKECRIRGNQAHFGGFAGMRSGGVRIA